MGSASVGAAVPTVASDVRVAIAGMLYAASYLLLVVLGIITVVGVLVTHVDPSTNPTAADLIVGGAFLWVVLTIGLYWRYYRTWVGAALQVPFGPARNDLPRTITPAIEFVGVPEFEAQARVKTLLGRAGKCWIELFGNGMRIWRGPRHAEPSWGFEYSDLVQAESTFFIAGPRTPEQRFVRLVAGRPLMAFLISSKDQTDELIRRLAGHHVTAFGGR